MVEPGAVCGKDGKLRPSSGSCGCLRLISIKDLCSSTCLANLYVPLALNGETSASGMAGEWNRGVSSAVIETLVWRWTLDR